MSVYIHGPITPQKIQAEILDAKSVLNWFERDIRYCMIMYRKLSKAGRRREAKKFYNKAYRYRKEAKIWKDRLKHLLEMKELMRRPTRA